MPMVTVQIKKAGQNIEIDTDKVDVGIYAEALRLGLEAMVNTKQSKVKTPKAQLELSEADAKAEKDSAMKIAADNLEAIYDGKFKTGRKAASANKVSREIMTEALRLARNTVKDAIKAAGAKISHVKASDITSAAKGLIEQDPEYLEKAKANLEANKVTVKAAIDVSSLVSPELVAKAKEKADSAKSKSAGIISATQAGLIKGRRKGSEHTVQ